MVYFARMLDKIRLSGSGRLRDDFRKNIGIGFDGRCTRYLHVAHAMLVDRVLEGGSDEEILEWCFANGRRLKQEEIFVWNQFMTKRGWKDELDGILQSISCPLHRGKRLKGCMARIVPNHSAFRKRNDSPVTRSSSRNNTVPFHPRTQQSAFRRRDARQQRRLFFLLNPQWRHIPNSNRPCSDCRRCALLLVNDHLRRRFACLKLRAHFL
jgi:hypothetical protein